MIAVIDYGMGNLRSVHKALTRLGAQAEIVQQPDELPHADKLILPGVGAFADAIARLRELRLDEAIREFVAGGRPLLGICLGMQMLFDVSYEDGEHKGLGILRGKVVKFGSQGDVMPPRIPHMGWNSLRWQRTGELLHGLEKECFAYFAHSYHVVPADIQDICTTTEYGYVFASSVQRGNVFATQFHPEKSQSIGLKLLANFIRL